MERRLARLPDGAGALARAVAVLGAGAPLRHAARLAGSSRRPRRGWPTRCARPACSTTAPELTLAHPLVERRALLSLGRGERALWHADAAELLARERADPERVALHLLRTDPAADPATVAGLRAAAARATVRGAPQNAAALPAPRARRAAADAGTEAELRLELGLALAAYLQPDAHELSARRRRSPPHPGSAARSRCGGARALGLPAISAMRSRSAASALEDPGDASPVALRRARGRAGHDAWLRRRQHRRGAMRGYVTRRSIRPPSTLWRVNCRQWPATLAGRPAETRCDADRRVLEHRRARRGAATRSSGRSLTLRLDRQRRARTAHAGAVDAIIETARPRGWLIALAHGCMLRAMARVRAGRVPTPRADARLTFDYKLPVTPRPAMLWSLHCLHRRAGRARRPRRRRRRAAPPRTALRHTTRRAGSPAPLVLQSRARLRLAQQRPADAHTPICSMPPPAGAELGVRPPDPRRAGAPKPPSACRLGDPASRARSPASSSRWPNALRHPRRSRRGAGDARPQHH